MLSLAESKGKHVPPRQALLRQLGKSFSVASGCAPIKKDSFLIESDRFVPGARRAARQDVQAIPDLSGHEAGRLSARKPKAGLGSSTLSSVLDNKSLNNRSVIRLKIEDGEACFILTAPRHFCDDVNGLSASEQLKAKRQDFPLFEFLREMLNEYPALAQLAHGSVNSRVILDDIDSGLHRHTLVLAQVCLSDLVDSDRNLPAFGLHLSEIPRQELVFDLRMGGLADDDGDFEILGDAFEVGGQVDGVPDGCVL